MLRKRCFRPPASTSLPFHLQLEKNALTMKALFLRSVKIQRQCVPKNTEGSSLKKKMAR